LKEVEDYLENNVPQNTLHKVCKHRLCALYQAIAEERLELVDGGGNQP
jgi:hypothetical protein